jgi:hypothetical protein
MKKSFFKLIILVVFVVLFSRNSFSASNPQDSAENFAAWILERPSHREVIVFAWICFNNEMPKDLWYHIILFCAAQPDQLRSETLMYLEKQDRSAEPFVCRMATTDEFEILFGLIYKSLGSNSHYVFHLELCDKLAVIPVNKKKDLDPFLINERLENPTWLHLARRKKLFHCLKIMLDSGVPVDQECFLMSTPLMIATTESSDEIVRLLLSYEADPIRQSLTYGSPSTTPLANAKRRRYGECGKRIAEQLEEVVAKRPLTD